MARGKKLELADGRTKAVCQRLEFYSPPERGELIGFPDRPVELEMATGERIAAERVRFDSDHRMVFLDGAGSMRLPAGEYAEAAGSEGPTVITWQRLVEVVMGRRETPGAAEETADYLRQARFVGNVEAHQGETRSLRADEMLVTFHEPRTSDDPVNRIAGLVATGKAELADTGTGEYIRADKLEVFMSPLSEQRVYQRRVMATGNVSARQEQVQLGSQELAINFAPLPDEKTNQIEIKATRLDAAGAVSIIDSSGDEPVSAEAERITADPIAGTATLIGRPAKVTQKDKVIHGEKITIDEPADEASVSGRGQLWFSTDTDLSGRKLDSPVPVRVGWTRSLEYDGGKRIAVFSGGVSLKMLGDSLECGRMSVEFAPSEGAATRPAPAGEATPDRRSAWETEFAARKITMVRAAEKVRLESVTRDENGLLSRRLSMRSDQVVFHATAKTLRSERPGWMMSEDYRSPREDASRRTGRSRFARYVSRPSQTTFRWGKSMTMDRAGSIVEVRMDGKVEMIHRAGRDVVVTKQLKSRLAPWGRLQRGRNMVLDCDSMLAEFDQAQEDAAAQSAGSDLGRLERFEANGNVNLVDDADKRVDSTRPEKPWTPSRARPSSGTPTRTASRSKRPRSTGAARAHRTSFMEPLRRPSRSSVT